jgi:predicted O-methyltransferase YrrM
LVEDLAYLRLPSRLLSIQEKTAELRFSMASEPLVGAMLRMLAASKPGGRFLELGTGTGVATAWLLDGMDGASNLISIDNDRTVQQVASDFLGADSRLTLVTSGGAEFLELQSPESFDLVFADAMPGKYEVLGSALAVIKVGGFYVVDDMLPQPNWPEGHADKVPVLIERLIANPRFEILPLVWATGVVIAVRKQSEDTRRTELLASAAPPRHRWKPVGNAGAGLRRFEISPRNGCSRL